jgi:hypothetical protein
LQNALKVVVYAVKHNISDLRDRAMSLIQGNFSAMIRQEPQVWDLISELPQSAVVILFRTVTEAQR